MSKKVLILGGSGKIGRHSREAFTKAGWEVFLYDRSRDDLLQAAAGMDVIVNGLNPPKYHDWKNLVPAITKSVIAAAKSSGATVIIPGNVYNFGATGGEWSEHTPHQPNTKKGQLREEMERAYEASGVRCIILRAGNFIDPYRNGDVMSLLLMRNIAKGKLTNTGDVTAQQAYCYLPDWARAAVLLAEMRGELSAFEDVPFPGHCFTLQQLQTFVSQELRRQVLVEPFPWLAMRLLSPFWELARELLEMRYLWSTSHSLSSAKFERLLPNFRATPLADVMRAGLPPEVQSGSAAALKAA